MLFSDRLEAFSRYVNAPYVQFLSRLGLALDFTKAKGAEVWDREGRRFIDCVAGYGNLNVGHNHPRIVEAVIEELRSDRPFNLPFLSDVQARFASKLASVCPGDLECSFVVNSGSEAVDTALKLARLSTSRPHVISTRGSWHGFTFGAMSVSEPSLCRAFGPLLPDVTHVAFGDSNAVREAITEKTGAVIVEPIESESGAIVPPDGYLRQLAEICAEKSIVLIFDEVKCGMGKTGKLFACEHEGVVPDILLAGKALGGGVMPIGSVTARRKFWGRFGFSFPMSSSSGAGNASACAAGLATLEVIEQEGLCESAGRAGKRFAEGLDSIVIDFPELLRGYSGRGLLLSLHTDNMKTSSAIVAACARKGVLIMAAFCDRTRLLIEPALCIEDALVDEVLEVLRESVRESATV